ncbi:GGDEF domain-containing protein [Aquabacterium sp.]|uniref:GGDEF domain-containing protein n=1 Tax=Aquabacterium sp. TaxID=1872578 RepID=UPI003784F139
MSKVVDHLAELTGFRDRDVLDTTLAGALRDLLQPLRVAIHRCVGEDNDRRWLTRARLEGAEAAASADPLWVEFDSLPGLHDYPARVCAIETHEPVSVAGSPHVTVFPLFTDRDVAGVVEVESGGALDAEQQRLVASILRIYRNFQSLLDYSERDTLTGLLNRKTFDEAFYKLSSQTTEASAASSGERRQKNAAQQAHYIGVLDIDHFKSVNDTYGHLIGDEVLLLLSRLMRSCFRYHDRLYRFGGEEFVVLMRCNSDADAGRAFERLRTSVAAYSFPQVGRITVSVGFTELKPGDTPSSAFERADKAVYWAKTHGRNQVCSHADLIRRGELDDDSKVGDVELF